MYCPDVVSLKQFYAGALGQVARTCIWNRLCALWPTAEGETILGLGYVVPYLAPECGKRDTTVAVMPAAQGALYWPQGKGNRVALADESRLPFPECTFNRVLIIHALEQSDSLPVLMQEVWRVLVPGGRMLAVVPNRLGLWSRSSRSPLGFGRPFSAGQLRAAVEECALTFTRMDSALFVPPTRLNWLMKSAGWLEKIGHVLCPHLGGVLFVEAEKQIYAALKDPVRAKGRVVISPVASAQPAFSP